MCVVSNMCSEYLEFGLLYRIACICFLYLLLKFLPVCTIYFSGHSLHFIWYIPLLQCVSMSGFLGFNINI
jgi:hypothetical protein